MGILALLFAFGLGIPVGGVGGIVLGFTWYERKCGLLNDHNGVRAAAIRAELDDVMERRHPRDAGSVVSQPTVFSQGQFQKRFQVGRLAANHSDMAP
jgi:hypothetical protein